MAGEIAWKTDLAEALAVSASENKPILFDFFSPR